MLTGSLSGEIMMRFWSDVFLHQQLASTTSDPGENFLHQQLWSWRNKVFRTFVLQYRILIENTVQALMMAFHKIKVLCSYWYLIDFWWLFDDCWSFDSSFDLLFHDYLMIIRSKLLWAFGDHRIIWWWFFRNYFDYLMIIEIFEFWLFFIIRRLFDDYLFSIICDYLVIIWFPRQ